MRIFLSFFFVIVTANFLYAQPGVAPLVEKGGKKYYEHTVEAGNTLWGLQQMYKVSSEEIIRENPELSTGLKVGQKILIPAAEVKQERNLMQYEVEKGETLYGISKKFNTTVDELIEINPELAEGLKKGQLIHVPAQNTVHQEVEVVKEKIEPLPNPFVIDTLSAGETMERVEVTFNDSIVKHTVLAHETLYSISKRYMVSIDELMRVNGLKTSSVSAGQVLTIPLKQERIERVEIREVKPEIELLDPKNRTFEKKERYKVAVLVPLYLDYGTGYSEYVSNLATQFYMGVELAIDSLEKKGLKADVYVYDTKNDSATVVKLLAEKGLANADLIIGPFFEKTQKLVADFCRKEGVRMVCPVVIKTSILENNPFVYAAVPSNITLLRGTAIHLLQNNKSDNILLIRTTKESDKALYDTFLKTFNEYPVSGTRPKLIETTIDDMKTFIKRGVNTIFVVPTIDKGTAMKFMNGLNRSAFRSNTNDLFVFGTKEWINFTDVNNVYKNKYNFHFAGPNFLDYYRKDVIEMNKIHRSRYKTDLSRMAVQGYDIMTYFCSDFFLDERRPYLIMNDFRMEQVSEADGFENTNLFIIEQEEFELIRSDLKEK